MGINLNQTNKPITGNIPFVLNILDLFLNRRATWFQYNFRK